jgi:hypothetical protein
MQAPFNSVQRFDVVLMSKVNFVPPLTLTQKKNLLHVISCSFFVLLNSGRWMLVRKLSGRFLAVYVQKTYLCML